jgi:hypothetical protein
MRARSHQNQRVLTCEDETAKRKAKTEPRAHRRRAIDEATRDPKNETHEEDVEHRLLDQPVKENDRGVERESQTGDQTSAPAEQVEPRPGRGSCTQLRQRSPGSRGRR